MPNIEEFKAKIQQVAQPSKYKVEIAGLPKPELCSGAVMPGISLQTGNWRSHIYGPVPIKLPYDVAFQDVQFTFIEDNTYSNRKFFVSWMNEVFSQEDGYGYFNDYNRDCTVTQLNYDGSTAYSVLLMNCYPVSLSEITFSAEQQNTYQTFTVVLNYWKWREA